MYKVQLFHLSIEPIKSNWSAKISEFCRRLKKTTSGLWTKSNSRKAKGYL